MGHHMNEDFIMHITKKKRKKKGMSSTSHSRKKKKCSTNYNNNLSPRKMAQYHGKGKEGTNVCSTTCPRRERDVPNTTLTKKHHLSVNKNTTASIQRREGGGETMCQYRGVEHPKRC